MLTQLQGTPKVTKRESGLPEYAQQRLVKLKMAVDDAEAARADIMKRMNRLRPDENMERAALDKKRIANDKLLASARGLATQVDTFLRKSGVLHHISPTKVTEAPPLIRIEEPQWGSIENFRRKVNHLKSEMADIRRAPLPFARVEAALKSIVDGWAKEARPTIKIDDGVDVTFSAHVKPHKLSAWLAPDQMLAQLVAQAREQCEARKEALTPEQKKDRLKDLADVLYETERREVAMIDAFIEMGEKDVFHRLDVDPAALLGIRVPAWALVQEQTVRQLQAV
jgi:hypothetical protein